MLFSQLGCVAASEHVKHCWLVCHVMLYRSLWPWLSWENGDTSCRWIKLVLVWVWCLVCGCGGSNGITCLSPSYLPFPSILSILTLLVYSKLHNPLCVGLWWPYSDAKTVHFTRTYTHASALSTFPHQGSHYRRFRTPLSFIPMLCSQFPPISHQTAWQ